MSSLSIPPLVRTPEEWSLALKPFGGRAFHGLQVFRWIHQKGVLDPAQMTNVPASLRAELTALELPSVLTQVQGHRSLDGTQKLLVRTADGFSVETVLLPRLLPDTSLPSPCADGKQKGESWVADDDEEDAPVSGSFRVVTQCLSTQVGCAMGCGFCASGRAGLRRSLRADEIVAQVLLGRSILPEGEVLRNLVFMGMGEPLHNYEETVRAIRLLLHPEGCAFSSRRVTVSTSGLVPEIARLGAEFGGQIGLAISLHAPDDVTRSELMPINRKYPLAHLMEALRAYPLPARRRITIEYTLIEGKNDRPAQAEQLARLLRGLPVKINLIPMNPVEGSPLHAPSLDAVLVFQKLLVQRGYSCFVRRTRGEDVNAACGQLALLGAKAKVKSFLHFQSLSPEMP